MTELSPKASAFCTGERVIAERRLPILGDYELRAVQELGPAQESPGKIGASTALKRLARSR
jgi:hypothetical protein